MTESEYICMWLCESDIYGKKIRNIEEYIGDLRELREVDLSELAKLGIISEHDAYNLNISREFQWIEEQYLKMYEKGIRMMTYDSIDYPAKLKEIYDKPYCLFYKGDMPREAVNIAIVGARECSEYGREIAMTIGKELGNCGVGVISGLARGIDTAAHKGTLMGGGRTYAVLGCGVDICYPRENIELYKNIIDKGGVISEYKMKTKPLPMRFPMRNRIISGMADAVIVVEAREKSGSLITVDQALEQNRDVLVVPGRITDKLSMGCNYLIKMGANVITSIEDLKEYIREKFEINVKKSDYKNLILETEEKIVYSYLDLYPKSLSELVEHLDMNFKQIIDVLRKLMKRGIVKETSKNYYIRV